MNSLPFADLSCFSLFIASGLVVNSSVFTTFQGLKLCVYPFPFSALCEANLAPRFEVKPT